MEGVANGTRPADRLLTKEQATEAANYALRTARTTKRPYYLSVDDVEEAALWGLAKAWDSWDPAHSEWRTWAINKVKWEIVDLLRRRQRRVSLTRFHQEYRMVELDNPHDTALEDEVCLHETIADPGQGDPAVVVTERLALEEVREALRFLPKRERYVLVRFYLEGRTQQEIGRELEISESRVHQLKEQAVFRLQGILRLPRVKPERQSGNESHSRSVRRLRGEKLAKTGGVERACRRKPAGTAG